MSASLPHSSRKASPCRNAAPFLSALIIITLFPYPSTTPLSNRSLFTLHSKRHTTRHIHAPYARTCSAPARHHFITRFTRAQRALLPLSPPTRAESRNRVFMSSIPVEVGDGLGHRTCILNYELFMSILLRLSYSHRISTYGSLTTTDKTAVESLFGWSQNELSRDEMLATSCAKLGFINDTCEIPATHVVCERVKPRRNGGMFDQTVIIPAYISDCLLQTSSQTANNEQQCASLFSTFLSAYSEPNTLFQLRPTRCFREYLYTNFSRTRDWFANKFWQRDVSASDVHGLDTNRIQVAMHVRRGDFFNYTNRVLIGDATFVDVAGRLAEALDDIIGATVPISIHMFSEGVSLQGERVKDNHDTSKMAAVYVDENGSIIRDEMYWTRLFRTHRRWKRRQHVEVKTHIASDTLEAVKIMVRSDFFIGSISGLSVQVVRHIGRGLMLMPIHELEVGEEEQIVTFDYGRHGFESFLREDELYKMVARSVRRNRLACSAW